MLGKYFLILFYVIKEVKSFFLIKLFHYDEFLDNTEYEIINMFNIGNGFKILR